jgi:hypothetical protein
MGLKGLLGSTPWRASEERSRPRDQITPGPGGSASHVSRASDPVPLRQPDGFEGRCVGADEIDAAGYGECPLSPS